MRFVRLVVCVLSSVSLIPATSSFAQSERSPNSNVFLRRVSPLSTGTISVGMQNYYFSTVVPSDSFTLQKQVYLGYTNCNCPSNGLLNICQNTGGGPVSYISNVSAASPD